jgi:hypothetical protein
MPKPKNRSSNQTLQHRRQKKTAGDDDSSVSSKMDVDEDSREEKNVEIATSTGSQVSYSPKITSPR